jgi:PAS domain S-box-containing protein
MSRKRIVHLIRERKHLLAQGALGSLKGSVPEDLPLQMLIETFLNCLTSILLSDSTVPVNCTSRLGWDLPETPSLLNVHRIMLAMKKEIVTALERELEGKPHLLVEAVCDLEDTLDAMMTFLLQEEPPARLPDLVRIGEVLSREYDDDIICIYDNEGNLLYISPSIEKILGYSISEWRKEGSTLMIANPVYEVSDSQPKGEAPRENVKYVVVIAHKNGEERIIEIEEKFIKGSKGEILGLWSRMHDVSERENLKMELEHTNQRYKEIFEEAGDIIFILDSEGKLISANRRLRELTGFSTDYLRGKHLSDLLHTHDREHCRRELEKLTRGKSVEFEARMFAVSGDHITTSVRCNSYLTRTNHDGVIGIARDITEKKRMERELEQKMHLLERFRQASIDREMRIRQLLEQLENAGGGERLD